MSNLLMTFDEFRASLAVYPWGEIPRNLKDDGMDEGESLLSYANGNCSIYGRGESYRLVIWRGEWNSQDLLALEQILYEQWYLQEYL